MGFISNITKSYVFVLTGCVAFLFVALQCTSLNFAAAQSSDKEVEFVSNIEQMKGHLEQAVANKENGNNSLTLAHVLHPIAELYDLIEIELVTADSNLNRSLATSLNELSKNVEKLDSSQFIEETNKVNGMLNNAIKLIVPEDNSTLNLIVVSNLLDTANAEYEEGVINGTIKQLVEYQDATGFISRAGSLFNDTSSMLDESKKTSADQVRNLFLPLKAKVQTKSDAKDIETLINEINQKVSSIIGFSTTQVEADTKDSGNKSMLMINNIRDLLSQLIEKQKLQSFSEAEEIATRAYLDNFEYIESDLAKHDKKLMEDTEMLLREELRQIIKDKKSIDEVQVLVDQINANLDRAEKLFS